MPLLLKRKSSPTHSSTDAGADPSTVPTPMKTKEPESVVSAGNKKNFVSLAGVVKTKVAVIPENTHANDEPSALDGREIYIQTRKNDIIKANPNTQDIETLAQLKCEEDWSKMTMDERCPWEEKAERMAQEEVTRPVL